MVEDKKIIDKLCIDKVTKTSTKSNGSGFSSNCDNACKVQHLITENSRKHRPFQFGVRDGEKKLQEVTVIATDHNSLNANSTIDSRACYKPEKKVIKKNTHTHRCITKIYYEKSATTIIIIATKITHKIFINILCET